jgi:hypothetical protein
MIARPSYGPELNFICTDADDADCTVLNIFIPVICENMTYAHVLYTFVYMVCAARCVMQNEQRII